MATLKQLRERRGNLNAKAHELIERAEAEDRDMTAEESASLKKIHDDDMILKNRIDRQEAQEKRDAELGELTEDPRDLRGQGGRNLDGDRDDRAQSAERVRIARESAVGSWARAAVGARLSKEERKNLRSYQGATPKAIKSKFSKTAEIRQTFAQYARVNRLGINQALSTHTASSGAVLVPTGFMPRLEKAMVEFSSILGVCEVITTDGGGDLPWPTLNDSSNEGVEVQESEDTASLATDPSFGSMVLHDYKYTTKPIVAPTEIFEDSAIDVAGVIGDLLGERAGRVMNRRFTTGHGANQPYGVVTRSVLGKQTAGSTAITGDEILELVHSVDPAYREQSRFMMHDNIILAIRKIKSNDNQYLWQPGLSAGVPDRLAAYPVAVNQHMASSVAQGNKTMLFGDFSKYKVRIVRTLRIVRLVEIYGLKDQVAFVGFWRCDGDLLNAGGNPIKHMIQV